MLACDPVFVVAGQGTLLAIDSRLSGPKGLEIDQFQYL